LRIARPRADALASYAGDQELRDVDLHDARCQRLLVEAEIVELVQVNAKAADPSVP